MRRIFLNSHQTPKADAVQNQRSGELLRCGKSKGGICWHIVVCAENIQTDIQAHTHFECI